MQAKIDRLQSIYDDFDSQAAPYRQAAACRKGCAFCCTEAGSIHITTLEGLAIGEAMARFAKPRRTAVKKALAKEMKRREQGMVSACPFLMKNKGCMIYAVRPFACRRVYSLETCRKGSPPVLHRQVMTLGDQTISALQRLDDTGYTGHLSYILHMLAAPGFLQTYLSGAFKPEAVTDFGKSHAIAINRMVAKD